MQNASARARSPKELGERSRVHMHAGFDHRHAGPDHIIRTYIERTEPRVSKGNNTPDRVIGICDAWVEEFARHCMGVGGFRFACMSYDSDYLSGERAILQCPACITDAAPHVVLLFA